MILNVLITQLNTLRSNLNEDLIHLTLAIALKELKIFIKRLIKVRVSHDIDLRIAQYKNHYL